MDGRLSIYSLGLLEVDVGGRALAGVSGGKMSALLMLLATRPGHRFLRDTLGDMLWPSLPIQSARKNLRHTLFHLREALGESAEPFLVFGRDWLGFNDRSDFWLDARELVAAEPRAASDAAQVERLAALYRGEFMAGFSLPDCQEFEDWLQAQREGLRRRALALLEHLANHHEESGGYDRGLDFARRLLALDPLNEALHRRVMRACALSGRPAAAQAQYDACRAVLWKELGVRPSEETAAVLRRIVQAEARSCTRAGGAPVSALVAALPTERRQVTVLYGELRLAGSEDVDEAAELLPRPQQRCAEIIRSHGGYIGPSHGGGLLAYFGYPVAREDAARQAVAAARAMCQAAAPAVIRCGIHTGLIATAPELRAPDLAGKTSELAIQLRLAAGEQGIVLSKEAFRLVEDEVRCLPLGAQALAPGDRPVEVYRIEDASCALQRSPTAAALSPFVGRSEELGRLFAVWRQAGAGKPAAVLVRGEPGIGKSRLVAELRWRMLAEGDSATLASSCTPDRQGTPFHPFTGLLAQAAPPAASPGPGHPPGDPEAQRRELMAAMVAALLARAGEHPLLVLVEDLQWADSSSLDLLRLLLEHLDGRRVLVLATSRPEFSPSWWVAAGATTVELEHLPEKASRQLAASLAAGLPSEQLERIVAQADGVPLFIEELAWWQSAEGREDRAASQVPATLHDLLMARIDQLGGARGLAQVAAAFGREFEPKLVAAVAKEGGEDVERGMQELLRSGLVVMKKERLRFKHALIQEAAYESLSRPLRRETHRRIARVLQGGFADLCRRRPEVLAHHLTEAGEIEPAIRAWRAAGDAAAECWSHYEAVLHYRKALGLLAQRAPSRERDKLELSLRVELGGQLIADAGHGDPAKKRDIEECFARAYSLCRDNDEAVQVFFVLLGRWWTATSYGSHADAEELTGRLIHLAQMSNRPEFLVTARCTASESLFWRGRYVEMVPHVEAARALLGRVEPEAYTRLFGVDPRVFVLSFLGLARWLFGRLDEALGLVEEMLAAAEQSGQASSKCIALSTAAIVDRYRGRPQNVLEHCETLASTAEAHAMPFWSMVAQCFRGWAWATQGKAEIAHPVLQALRELRKDMPDSGVAYGDVYIDAMVALGRHEQVLAEVDGLIDAARRRGDEHTGLELRRLKGEALFASSPGRRSAAEACIREALELAQRAGARMLELRAAASLFRVMRDAASRELLARLAALFDERTDHPDVQLARRLGGEDAPIV